ncbi:cytochrome P450 [Hypomontagnella monticulosa]|nr:cytochrome P450 [Hypomontagnella monticulosa]
MDSHVIEMMKEAATYAVGGLLLLIIFDLSYQLLFHPLRDYPGPLAGRLTSGYGAFYTWRRCLHVVTYNSFQKYGSVVRISPNRLVFNTVTALNDIYNNSRVVKGRAYALTRQERTNANVFNSTDKAEHRRKRKIIGPIISERSMHAFEPVMSAEVDIFLQLLLQSSRKREVVDMTERCERLGVDVVGQLAFGYALNSQREPTHRAVVEGIKSRSARGSLYMLWSTLSYFDPVIDLIFPPTWRADMDSFHRSLRTMIGTRMALPKDAKHDFYAQASGEIAPGEPGMPGKELWAEAALFIAAGGSTTSTAMTAALFYLSRNPEAYSRLASEIRGSFTSGREIRQGPDLAACKYLRAVIDEALRLAPGTISFWREQEPTSAAAGEPFIVEGRPIPPGVQVAINPFCLMRNPDYFDDPLTFKPERWLARDDEAAGEKEKRATMRRVFVPFAHGDRACAGKAMAYLELSLVLARTMWYFDFEKAPGPAGALGEEDGNPNLFQMQDGIVVGHQGPNLVFKPREKYANDLEV